VTHLIQESLDQALTLPSAPRLWTHVDCGGYVLFALEGGTCLHCKAGPLHVGEYEKATGAAA
jgi:hypothetical protein